MVVRVRVQIAPLKGSKKTSQKVVAIANAGFGSKVPELLIPPKLAERLGLWPSPPEGTEVSVYGVAGGMETKAYRIPNAAEAVVKAAGRISSPVKVCVAIMEGEREVILSDKTIDALGIELLMPGEGI